MDKATELAIVRRAYAKQVLAEAQVSDSRIEAAFATVPREDFLGPGPWLIPRWLVGPVARARGMRSPRLHWPRHSKKVVGNWSRAYTETMLFQKTAVGYALRDGAWHTTKPHAWYWASLGGWHRRR
jgi:hypothetical protein